jgi:hypothetical protein
MNQEPNMQHSNKAAAVLIAVVMLIVGGLAGYAIAKSARSNDSNAHASASVPSSDTKAADLRSGLVSLGVEHMMLTDQAVSAALDGTGNASATGAALYKNGTNIGAAVGSVYGKDAETTFNTVWKLHLDEFVKYAVASKSGDAAGKQAALDTIDNQYTKPLAQYLAKANPNLPEKVLESSLREHVQMTAQMIDAHVQGDYTAETDQLAMANKHLEGLFSTLAAGIVKQYPEKF